MDSRLLATLNSEARNTRDPLVWARTVCRASAHYSRHGMTTEALKAISVVRDHYGIDIDPEIASWLMLAEGVLHYFQADTKAAYSRIKKAYGLAMALDTTSAMPICAAWMAHIEFHDGEYTKMYSHIEEALTLAQPDDHAAHARAALVLANSYQLAGSYSFARPWYEKARLRAADDGDNATLSAMLYNVAAFRAANVRLDDTFGIYSEKELHRAGMEMASSRHYDHAIGTRGLDFLSLLLRALIETIGKRFPEALDLFSIIDPTKLQAQMLTPMYVDMAWCQANNGNIEAAETNLKKALDGLQYVVEPDDKAYSFSRISQILILLNRSEESEPFKETANEALRSYRNFQASLLVQLHAIRKQ